LQADAAAAQKLQADADAAAQELQAADADAKKLQADADAAAQTLQAEEEAHAMLNVNAELASLALEAYALIDNAIAGRMTNVKGCLSDPFIHLVHGHVCKKEVAGLGYNSHMEGFVIGLDDVWTFTNERYLRLGVVFEYVQGKTTFSGSAAGREKSAKHDIYAVEMFGAYELFNSRNLKTNIGFTIGYGLNNNRLHRVVGDLSSSIFDAKVRLDSIFMGIEFVKNLYTYKGFHFGPWFKIRYDHLAQKGYDESTKAPFGAQHVSAVKRDYLTTVVGLNIEKEIIDAKYADRKLTFSWKAGWEYQMLYKRSEATLSFDNNWSAGKFTVAPTRRYPLRSSAIVSLGVSRKFNIHWGVVGACVARFNKSLSTYSLSCGVEYSF
jgi:uncharacterized protein with beta-barrel porin domain